MMKTMRWLQLLLGGVVLSALLAMPGLPLPGADRLGLSGSAQAQATIDIDTFYDELGDYGQWVWHPRFGYVWLPEDVSPNWRPYTVGHWVSTEDYGWYWESNEPFAWAVYHYGRWGYDPDYGWFWVPGDTWAPAWVQWRYDDQYVGWAPIGPRREGYAYGVPTSYEPPIAESWVFVQPRYMTSRAIRHYAVPIADLGVVFLGATNVYRPQYRNGRVYNYGMPRDRVVRITKRPIYVQKIYKVDNWKGGRYDKRGHKNGINVYAPGVHKNGKPHRGPKKFVDNPDQFKPKTKLKHTFKGEPPKGFGRSAKDVKSIAKQDPDAFKRKKNGKFGGPGDGRGDKDRDQDKGKNFGDRDNKDFKQGKGAPDGKDDNAKDGPDNKDFKQGKNGKSGRDGKDGKAKGAPDNQDAKQGGPPSAPKNLTVDGKQNGGPPPPKLPPPVVKGATGEKSNDNAGTGGGGKDRDRKGGKDKNKQKNFGAPGGPNGSKQGNRDNDRDRNKGKAPLAGQDGPNQAKSSDDGNQGGGNKTKNKDRDKGERGGNKNQQFSRPDGGQQNQGGGQGGGGGGDNGNKNKNKKDKCQKHPEKPECQ